jgi:hypothetical protein
VRSALVGAAVGVLGAAFAYGWLSHGREPPRSANPSSELSSRLGEVEQQLRDVRRQAEVERAAAVQARSGPSPAPASSPAAIAPAKPRMTEAEREQRLSARLDRQFDGEREDPSWSERAARELSDAVGASLPHSTLEAARCGSSLCRLSLTHRSQQAADEFTAKVAHMREFASEAIIRHVGTETEPRSVVYLARPGHPLNLSDD